MNDQPPVLNEDYWKDGYQKLYNLYDFQRIQIQKLEDEIKLKNSSIDELVADKMLLSNEVETMKRMINEMHTNVTLDNHSHSSHIDYKKWLEEKI